MKFKRFLFGFTVFTVVALLCITSCAVPELAQCLSNGINAKVYGSLPLKIYIDTEGNAEITSKETYIGCDVSVKSRNTKDIFLIAKIKGRGNSTWEMPKKSYKLKFSEKVALIGDKAAKTWTLIANYGDQSLMRNKLAYAVGALLEDQHFTTEAEQAELYLNGEYMGVYLICEQVETGDGRVEISGFSDSPEQTGYLIELDSHVENEGVEGTDWFSIADGLYAIKEPDIADKGFSDKHFAYIESYVRECFDAVKGENYGTVCDLLDIGTFADVYIVHELFHCCDVGFASFYMYKDAGGKLSCGPIWDFDISSGNCNYNASFKPDMLWASTENVWYKELLGFKEFKDEVACKLRLYETLINETIKREVYAVLPYYQAFDKNFERWHVMNRSVWPNTDELAALKNWSAHMAYLQDWLNRSFEYMMQVYCG